MGDPADDDMIVRITSPEVIQGDYLIKESDWGGHMSMTCDLQTLEDPDKDIDGLGGVRGCAFCGGLGHRITECPKLEKDAKRISGNNRDTLARKAGHTGDW